MGAFDHIVLLLSFVYALAITHLLTTVALLIRHSARVVFSWMHAFWMLNALLVIMANWIGFWDMRGLPSWNVASIFFTFVVGFVNYLQAALVCPEVKADAIVDLPAFLRAERLRIGGSFLASALTAAAGNAVYGAMFGSLSLSLDNLATVPMVAAAVAVLVSRNRWVHAGAAVMLLASWTAYFAVLQPALK